MHLAKARWLVVDTETTGLDTGTARVCELGAVPFVEGQPGKRRGMLLDPGCPIPEGASAVHGITDEAVRGKPRLADVADGFLGLFAQADVVVGYNLLTYDAPLLEAQLGDAWRAATADKPFVDPLIAIRDERIGKYWRGRGRHRLTSVAQRMGIVAPGRAHRATTDCVFTGLILWRLIHEYPDAMPWHDVVELAALLPRLALAQQAEFDAWRRSQPRNDGEDE